MAEVRFYALQRRRLEAALAELVQEGFAAGLRVAVQAGDAELVASLDDRLWTFDDQSFLPHGLANTADSARQPLTLGEGGDNPNGAQWRIFVGGADPAPFLAMESPGYERLMCLFDNTSNEAKAAARKAWTAAKALGVEVGFWREGEEGGWARSR